LSEVTYCCTNTYWS